MAATLIRHPASAGGEALHVEAAAERRPSGLLALRYTVTGDLGSLRVPPAADAARTDELWRHTCFEAFIRGEGEGYDEINVSPSTEWATYRFDGYRAGMRPSPDLTVARVWSAITADRCELAVEVAAASAPGSWRVGLSAIVEDLDGRISYWALAHAPGKPDFHHLDSFVLDLPPPDSA